MTDEELIETITVAIGSLSVARQALAARLQGVCLHPDRVEVGTFADPGRFMCADCGKGYE